MSLASLTCLTRSSAKVHPSEQPARSRVSGRRPWPVVTPVAGSGTNTASGGERRQRGGHGGVGRGGKGRGPGSKDCSGGPLHPLLPLRFFRRRAADVRPCLRQSVAAALDPRGPPALQVRLAPP